VDPEAEKWLELEPGTYSPKNGPNINVEEGESPEPTVSRAKNGKLTSSQRDSGQAATSRFTCRRRGRL